MRRQTAEGVMRIIHGFAALQGFSKRELAAICMITPQTWSRREREPDTFTLGELIALSKKLGCTLGEICEGQKGA